MSVAYTDEDIKSATIQQEGLYHQRYIVIKGQTLTTTEFAQRIGKESKRFSANLSAHDDNVYLAAQATRFKVGGLRVGDNVYGTIKEAVASESPVGYGTFLNRINLGWKYDDAFFAPKGVTQNLLRRAKAAGLLIPFARVERIADLSSEAS